MSTEDQPTIVEENKQEEQTVEENQGEDILNEPKTEKKIRKALMKLGMNKVEGVNRVTLKQKENYFFVVKSPEVYVSKEAESSYVIFGEITMDEENQGVNPVPTNITPSDETTENKPNVKIVEEEDEGEVSEGELDKESIEMIVNETKCSRQKAVKALKKYNGDVVNAILELNN
jgi:nascent polypeptide-associated complex subunit alpha